ncbi:uncharacterized protein [Nicotiana tomentosiformis]|uniref:uncharacterized protein isoform X1 n=1 Tax=Nicotiana tomentosiformis TaxID=4098 RepID=UPI00051B8F94|nr:uncharacterized protein LOC104101178 isoform X1 [Nicotiana tomentosiformis]
MSSAWDNIRLGVKEYKKLRDESLNKEVQLYKVKHSLLSLEKEVSELENSELYLGEQISKKRNECAEKAEMLPELESVYNASVRKLKNQEEIIKVFVGSLSGRQYFLSQLDTDAIIWIHEFVPTKKVKFVLGKSIKLAHAEAMKRDIKGFGDLTSGILYELDNGRFRELEKYQTRHRHVATPINMEALAKPTLSEHSNETEPLQYDWTNIIREKVEEIKAALTAKENASELIRTLKQHFKDSNWKDEKVVAFLWDDIIHAVQWPADPRECVAFAHCQVKTWKDVLIMVCTTKKLKRKLMYKVQDRCFDDEREGVFPIIVRCLYSENVLAKGTIRHWFNIGSNLKGRLSLVAGALCQRAEEEMILS